MRRFLRRFGPGPVYGAERRGGETIWWSASVASYLLALRLLVLPAIGIVVIQLAPGGWDGDLAPRVMGASAAPSLLAAAVGALCALADRWSENPFGWWGPWTFLKPMGSALSYVFGRQRV